MKSLIYNFRKTLLTAICCTLIGSSANAIVYTAVLSGNFNAAATWGGIAPGSILSSDVVVIPSGINVTLTGAQTFSGSTSLTVNGTLTAGMGSPLIITAGTLAGSGDIMVDSASLSLVTGFTFTGMLHTRKLTSMGVGVGTAANITVTDGLELSAGNMNVIAGSLTMGNYSDIAFSGGTLSASGSGMLMLDSVYNVWYNAAITTGAELNGSGLDDVYVNTAGTVTLGANATIDGMLTLTSGTFSLNGRTLTFGSMADLAASGTGTIMGSGTSSIMVNSTAGLTGTLRFAAGGNTLNNLTINTSSTGNVMLGSDLTVNGMLTLTAGGFALNGYDLIISTSGDIAAAGTGTIWGNSSSDITVNATGGLTGALNFASAASTIGSLTINTGSSSSVHLGTSATVNGMIMLNNGYLALNGNTLTIGTTGDLSASGMASIMGSTTSNLIVNSTAGLTGALRFAAAGNMLNDLTINTGSGSTTLNSDLGLSGTLTLSSGSLSLNGYTLTVNSTGNVAASGTGNIMGSATSRLVVNSTAGVTGAVRFASGSNMLQTLTVNTGSGTGMKLGSDLTVNGWLNLQSGKLRTGANNLRMATGSIINGGSIGSYIVTDDEAGTVTINLTASQNDTFEVGTEANYAPIIIYANAASGSGDVSVYVRDGVAVDGTYGSSLSTTAKVVNATWFVTSTATSIDYNMMAAWSTSMELNGLDRNQVYLSHYTGGAWDVHTAAAAGDLAGMHSIMRTGITSLSPFMVSDADRTTSTTAVAVNVAKVAVYPNPTTNVLHFAAASTIDKVCVYDVNGKCVITSGIANDEINVSALPAGIYVAHITGKDVNAKQEFVKQ